MGEQIKAAKHENIDAEISPEDGLQVTSEDNPDLVESEDGQAMVEYVIMVAIIISFMSWILVGLPEALSSFFDSAAFIISMPLF